MKKDLADETFRREVGQVIAQMEIHLKTRMGDYDEKKKEKMTELLTFCISMLRNLPTIREASKLPVVRNYVLWLTKEIIEGPGRWEKLMLATALEETVGEQIREMILQDELKEAKENGTTIQ